MRSRLALALALMAAGGARAELIHPVETPPSPLEQPAAPQGALERGFQALERKDPDAAERAFTGAAKADPKSAAPLIGLAEVAAARGRQKEAGEWLDKALALAPKSPQVHHALARHHFLAGRYAKAEAELKQVIALEPANRGAQVALGDLYLNHLKSPIQAIPAYRAAIALDAQRGDAHYGLGLALAGTGKAALAEESLRRAAGLSPRNPLAMQALGRLHAANGKTKEALAAYEAALEAQPGFAPVLLDRGDLHLDRGDAAAALKEYRLAAAAAPKFDQPRLKAGMALQALARNEEAEAEYRAAILLNPRLALAYNNLAWMYAQSRRDPAQALAWARKAVELAPVAAPFHDTLGWILRGQGELAEAEKVLAGAVKMKPESAETWHHLGVVYLERKKTDDAVKAFRSALRVARDYAPAREALAKLGR